MNARRRLLQAVLAASFARPHEASAVPGLPDVARHALRIGETSVTLVERQSGRGGWTYLNLHENEATSVRAAETLLAGGVPGRLLELRAQRRRLITFRLGGRAHAFDPNRIFSDAGIAATLARHGVDTPAAREALRGFAAALLAHLSMPRDQPLVVLHNGGLGQYSVASYRPGGTHAGDARALAEAAGRHDNDFFLVTRKAHFAALRDAGFNVVWQSQTPSDDGSLSVRFGREDRAYVNVEARHGAVAVQQQMLQAAVALSAAG